MTTREAARHMARCWRQRAGRGLIAGPDGNEPLRVGRARVRVTTPGPIKAPLRRSDMLDADRPGRKWRGRRNPTSELDLHLRTLQRRLDVTTVVHAHPPTAPGGAVAGRALDALVPSELILQCGRVSVVPYETPGSRALGARIERYSGGYDAWRFASQGAVSVGATLDAAWIRMESREHAARRAVAARLGAQRSESREPREPDA